MCFARLNRRSQTSHKDGKAYFQNNIDRKVDIQLLAQTLFFMLVSILDLPRLGPRVTHKVVGSVGSGPESIIKDSDGYF